MLTKTIFICFFVHLIWETYVIRETYLNDGGADPARVGQHKREEQIGVNLVPQASHLPVDGIK